MDATKFINARGLNFDLTGVRDPGTLARYQAIFSTISSTIEQNPFFQLLVSRNLANGQSTLVVHQSREAFALATGTPVDQQTSTGGLWVSGHIFLDPMGGSGGSFSSNPGSDPDIFALQMKFAVHEALLHGAGLTHGFGVWYLEAKAGGNTALADAMGRHAAEILNGATSPIGARVVAPEFVESQYGHIASEYKFAFYRQPDFRNGTFDTHADSPDEAVRGGVVRTLQHARFEGLDPIMARALYRAGPDVDMEQLLAQLQVAAGYRKYLADTAAINALILAAPDSAFAAGWGATLSAAAALGLDDPESISHQRFAGNRDERTHVTAALWGGNDGNYRLIGGVGHDTLYGGIGADELHGEDLNDTLVGGGGRDRLYGGTGDDRLFGQSGDDVLVGGSGNNHLDEGEGDDVADYSGSVAGVDVDLGAGSAKHHAVSGYTDENGQHHVFVEEQRDTVVGVESEAEVGIGIAPGLWTPMTLSREVFAYAEDTSTVSG